MYKVLKSFSGELISATKGKTISIKDKKLANSLLKAGFITEYSEKELKSEEIVNLNKSLCKENEELKEENSKLKETIKELEEKITEFEKASDNGEPATNDGNQTVDNSNSNPEQTEDPKSTEKKNK